MRRNDNPSIVLVTAILLLSLTGCADNTPVPAALAGYLPADVIKDAEQRFFGKTVLGLYKSTDAQTERENEINFFLAGPLKAMGLELKFWDIDSGIPGEDDIKNVRALVSWFRTPEMTNPEGYLDFLDAAITSGRKLLVIENFGAYKYRKPGAEKFVEPSRVNLTLSRLGIWYNGDWTEDPGLLRIVTRVPEMVEKGGPQDVAMSKFYYTFLAVDRDLDVYLSIKRTDIDAPPSPVITTNRNGGFILNTYAFRQKDKTVTMLVDLERFAGAALFPAAKREHVGLLTDMDHPHTKKIAEYAMESCMRTKLPVGIVRKEEFKNLVPGDLSRFTAVGLVVRTDDNLAPKLFEDFLGKGGGLTVLYGGSFKAIAPALAATPVQIDEKKDQKVGFSLDDSFAMTEGQDLELIGIKDEKAGKSGMEWTPGGLSPAKDAEILGTDYATKYPLLWTAVRGTGRVLVWNWNGFAASELAGLMVDSLLFVRPVGAASVLGFGHMFIDDWPLPMYNVEKEPIKGITDTEFYTKRWWPDIKRMFAEKNVPYSSYVVFNYNATVTPPFSGGEFFAADGNASYATTREILASGTELGYHGYNHMSLTMAKSVNLAAWPSQANMELSLAEGRRTWIDLFGNHTLPFGYVAVNNIISEEGVRALSRVFPSIKVVAALHWGAEAETYTPIGTHPAVPGMYWFPRITFGYFLDNPTKNLLVSGASGLGFLSHFIHPDDVYDEYRGRGKSWQELRDGLSSILSFTAEHYPWIKWVSLREAYDRLQAHDRALFQAGWNDARDTLTVNGTSGLLFRVRTNGMKLRTADGVKTAYAYKKTPYIVFELTAPEARLTFGE